MVLVCQCYCLISPHSLTDLTTIGCDVWMVTGDNQATAEALADDLDIALDRVIAGMINLSSSSSIIIYHYHHPFIFSILITILLIIIITTNIIMILIDLSAIMIIITHHHHHHHDHRYHHST